jgi:hypothetical protein
MTKVRLLVFFFALMPIAACAQNTVASIPAPEKILFVGNSFIYYNNSLHNHYRALNRSAVGESVGRARSMTISGGQLPEHAAGLPAMLASEEWDIVVLQGHSRGPIEKATAIPFRIAARDYTKLIREVDAKPVFFMTWAYENRPEMTALLDDAYSSIGAELNAQVVPVGLAFEKVSNERPDVALRTADGRHPTLAGTYLAACTFFAALNGRSAEGLDYDAGLDAGVASYLQRSAWMIVQSYSNRER